MPSQRNAKYLMLGVFAAGIVLLYWVLRGHYLLSALVLAGIYATVILGIVLLAQQQNVGGKQPIDARTGQRQRVARQVVQHRGFGGAGATGQQDAEGSRKK